MAPCIWRAEISQFPYIKKTRTIQPSEYSASVFFPGWQLDLLPDQVITEEDNSALLMLYISSTSPASPEGDKHENLLFLLMTL